MSKALLIHVLIDVMDVLGTESSASSFVSGAIKSLVPPMSCSRCHKRPEGVHHTIDGWVAVMDAVGNPQRERRGLQFNVVLIRLHCLYFDRCDEHLGEKVQP